jgi:hypothetical protein
MLEADKEWNRYPNHQMFPTDISQTLEESAIYFSSQPNITDYVNRMIPQFIMGTAPLTEASWADYVRQLSWQYHEWPIQSALWKQERYQYAPDVRQVGEYLYFCASNRGSNCTFYRSKDPMKDDFEPLSSPFPFWDPNLFADDDGRVYFFWGCGIGEPIYGIEMNRETMEPTGGKQAVINADPYQHGFERAVYPGREKKQQPLWMKLVMALVNRGKDKNMPYFEGAFVNKFEGRYYLQYAAPAADSAVYADGVYVAENPLGPYVFQTHNPYSLRPRGFITGAGHGSTIADKHGNLWHASTMRISTNHVFERRVGIFPAGIDADGNLFCNQNFADYPLDIPEGKFDPLSLKPKWMLLSYKKKAGASSSLPGHGPELALNEDIRSCWCAASCKDEWYKLDLGNTYRVHAIQVNFADHEVPALRADASRYSPPTTTARYIADHEELRTRYVLEGSRDGKTWTTVIDKSNAETDLSHDYLRFENPLQIQYLRITVKELPYRQRFALSGLRVFGEGKGAFPAEVTGAAAEFPDAMTAIVRWDRAEGAMGYNVRIGIAPDKLYLSYQVYEDTQTIISAINKGQPYYLCVDSFNEKGITPGKTLRII